MAAGADPMLVDVAVYLGATVGAVALFRRIGLGSVLGYLAAGAVIGPSVLGLIEGGGDVLHIAEFGVVLLLFVIGLELQPQRLWRMRGEIFGLGGAQVGATGVVLAAALWGLGLSLAGALVAGLALALSSTAFGVQLLRERGEFAAPHGRRAFWILLFQDIAVVPLLALTAFLSPLGGGESIDRQIVMGVLAIGGLLIGGRFLLPRMFRAIALAKADEVFTAAALLVVAASALLMDAAGLSMALGAFLAGVLLSETEFRHQLETDIEPFRSLFLGLFFVAVGMSVDWGLAVENAPLVLGGAVALYALKAAILYRVARLRGSSQADAMRVAATLGQAGEFAFVLLGIAAASTLIDRETAGLLTATVGVSMALTPAALAVVDRFLARRGKADEARGLDDVSKAKPAPVIVAGFGRTGQIIARMLQMRGYELTLIDNSPQRIRIAESIGDKVFFGDGSRLDVLTMAGAKDARAIFLCINDREGAKKAVGRLRERFPDQLILAMTYDRFSDIAMREAGADVVIREVFESAVALARQGLHLMGDNEDLDALVVEFRRRDEEMLRLQIEHGMQEGIRKMREKYAIAKAN
ncbi:MAG: monovalent cation:proton antiporter-2 (CPA2) family protein [Rubrimonas sp.]|uniref:monovalent cation:proton antiporter-2 (CPA2) family protein n=1 Tax=Rubrimonas sp. TaxID=2036015 RepID=UPI002FDD7432